MYKKTTNQYLPAVWLIVVAGWLIGGCVKSDTIYSNQEGQIYMPQAYSDKSKLTLYKIDADQTVTFGASIAGFDGASRDLNVEFSIDTSLIQAYNADNAYQNYNYKALPSDAYTVDALKATIKKGQSNSDPLSITISASKLSSGVSYVLPVRISSISAGRLDSTMDIAYFRIDSLYIRSTDITSYGTLSVSNENAGGATATEGSPHVVDNNYTTKFYTNGYNTANFWLQLKMDSSRKVDAYTMTSGNDASERDPKDWQFQGSDDGVTWVTLDSHTSYAFASRYQTVNFELNQDDGLAHKYFRLLITNNNGGGVKFQLEEWRLLHYY